MAFDYSEFCVLWTFHNAMKDTYDPDVEDLDDWDSQLRETYETKLVPMMVELSIPLTRENKSRIVALAEVSNGQAAGTRLRNACRFFQATKDLPLDS